ncbi:hypothetical protein HNQ34_003034 [Anoxybacillus tepidamans]|uniref:Sporulation histidine kinase inhibitor Sda n=1 Tax=Anoxybacteroides tepidamans TaxID=265948 RepID=A0A7W8ISJ3_9BACL|nr:MULTISPECIES: sporulation histidine kinase inhibitor Sda [Bacillaceae]EMI10850.1 hypothetical protein F510_0979 [Anoxybacillus gonensis]MBB5325928.1 hypothetical protein [Anoxybacillus tepidamans]MCL6586379.1 sporulation histidine kinase inhibitor Sda [Anoxybacillus sp.]
MHYINDKLLIESYKTAVKLKLNKGFIQILLSEIKRRKLKVS